MQAELRHTLSSFHYRHIQADQRLQIPFSDRFYLCMTSFHISFYFWRICWSRSCSKLWKSRDQTNYGHEVMYKLQINYVWKMYWKISICLKMAMEDRGEIVPKIAGCEHPAEPRRRARSIEWPRRSPMAAPPARRGRRRAENGGLGWGSCVVRTFQEVRTLIQVPDFVHWKGLFYSYSAYSAYSTIFNILSMHGIFCNF